MERCLTELEKRPGDSELVSEVFRAVHTIKGTTGFLGYNRLERLAHAGESLLGALRDGKLAVTNELISGLLRLMDGLHSILQTIEKTGTESEQATDNDDALIAQLLQLKDGEFVAKEAYPLHNPEGQKPKPTSHQDVTTVSSTHDKTLRIDVEVLNRMMNQVGELVLTRNQILRSTPGAADFPELARRLDNVTAELRESVMRARMQPMGHLFSKFPRMVRDLAITCGRQVRIEFEGQETGLDKSLLEAVRDPLTHAVRNAIDHGIEPPEERLKAGKPAEGVVLLRAFHKSGSVVIEVIDDGAGISTSCVRTKAVERGLLTSEQADEMSEHEALQMIFMTGFSTAKQVTNISGRGIGMDVVRANVEMVGGSVELESAVGLGTTVRMRVPLTLAIVPALVVRSGGQCFALPQSSLVELVYVPQREAEQAVERIGTTQLYRLREGLLPLVWLDRLLGLEPSADTGKADFYIAVVESDGRRYGLVTDDLNAPEEIVVKPLSAELRDIGIFSGATVLGNGTLALILDIAATGARAGVRQVAEDVGVVDAVQTQAETAQIVMESSMVIYESGMRGPTDGGNGEQMAMPLSAVERIESVPLSEIEYAGGRAVLQYRGELIPLEDEGDVLHEMRAKEGSATATVLICLRPKAQTATRVGMVVRRVLDVSMGKLLATDAAACEQQLAMVNHRVKTVHREYAQTIASTPATVLREVA